MLDEASMTYFFLMTTLLDIILYLNYTMLHKVNGRWRLKRKSLSAIPNCEQRTSFNREASCIRLVMTCWCHENQIIVVYSSDTCKHVSSISVAHLGRQQVHLHDVKTPHSRNGDSYDLLQQEDQTGNQKPLPEVCTVNHQQRPDPHIGQVRPVEHLEGNMCQTVSCSQTYQAWERLKPLKCSVKECQKKSF